jgi:hypothetical protein
VYEIGGFGQNEEITVRGEFHGTNGRHLAGKTVQRLFRVSEVPDASRIILSSSRNQRLRRREGQAEKVVGVARQSRDQLAIARITKQTLMSVASQTYQTTIGISQAVLTNTQQRHTCYRTTAARTKCLGRVYSFFSYIDWPLLWKISYGRERLQIEYARELVVVRYYKPLRSRPSHR